MATQGLPTVRPEPVGHGDGSHYGAAKGEVGEGQRRGIGISLQSDWPTLQGPHNAQNAAAAIETCRILEVGEGEIAEGLRTYPGLPHRTERVREMDGVLFVNDSKATNPTATAPALAAFDRIRWILGGQAKTDNLDECKPFLSHVEAAYTIGEAGELFQDLLTPHSCGEKLWKAGGCGAKRPLRTREPVIRCSCRRLARASTSSATSRSAAISSGH